MKEIGYKIKNFAEDNKDKIVLGTLAIGVFILYSKSFDDGYNSRKFFEECCDSETGSNVVKILKEYGDK